MVPLVEKNIYDLFLLDQTPNKKWTRMPTEAENKQKSNNKNMKNKKTKKKNHI